MIEPVPASKAVVVNVATSFETVPLPSRVEPSKKATVPVGWAEPVLAGVIVAVNVTGVPNVAEPGVNVRAVVVAIGVTGGETVNVADSMSEFAVVGTEGEVVVDALPTATTSPLLKAVTPVRPSWLLPGFALVTGLQLVPLNCAAIVPKPVSSPFELEKPSPTA